MRGNDFHIHTSFCDGKNTPEEIVKAAIGKYMHAIGFSVHSYTPFDESYCIPREKMEEYIAEIRRLREAYKDEIRIFCGAERDLYAPIPEGDLDYTIGSLHYVYKDGVYYTVDESADALRKAIAEGFGGDPMAFAEAYFSEYARLGENKPDILGHFDLLTKFNENGVIFDEEDPRYIAAAKKALDSLLPLGIPFEVNVGAMSRGYRTTPYPAARWIGYIAERGGKLIYSSDAHSTDGLQHEYYEVEELITECGALGFVSLFESPLTRDLRAHMTPENCHLAEELIYVIESAGCLTLEDLKEIERQNFTVNGRLLSRKEQLERCAKGHLHSYWDYDGRDLDEINEISSLKKSLTSSISDEEKIYNDIRLNDILGNECSFPAVAYGLVISGKY